MSIYSRIAKALSVIGLVLVIAPFVYAFVGNSFDSPVDILVSVGIPLILVSLGYFMQALVGKITKYKRVDPAFDTAVRYVDLGQAVVPFVICFISYFPFCSLVRAYRASVEVHYDPYSLGLYLIPALFSLAIALGVVLWFYPYHRIVHNSLVYAYGAGFLAGAVISAIFGVGMTFQTVCFVIFLGIFFTVCNLRSIEEALFASKFRVPSNDFRSYNIYLTLKRYAITLLSAVLLFSVVFLIGSNIRFSPMDTSTETEEKAEEGVLSDEIVEAEKSEPGKEIERNTRVSETASILSTLCSIVVVGAFFVLVLYLLFRKHLLRRLFALIAFVAGSIREFMIDLFGIFENRGESDIPANYVDTESVYDCNVEYSYYGIAEELTPKSFDAALNGIDTADEKLAYAYSVYCRLVRGDRYGVKASDTPRMITAKLTAQRKPDLEGVTPVYEHIRYRELPADPRDCEAELKSLCRIIKDML